MSSELRLRQEAEQDIEEAALWYERQQNGLGEQFLDEVESALRAIAEQPSLYPVVHRATRRALIGKFPFGVYYRIENATILIVAVMHGRRNPQRWMRRG